MARGGAAFGALFLVALLIAAAGLWIYAGPGPKARSGEVTIVTLRKGAGLSQIAAVLEREGVVRSSSVFLAAAQFTGGSRSLKAGEYEFASGASMSSILQAIRDGRIVRRQVTIPEGMTADMVVDILNAQPVLTGVAPTPAEGSVLPETYDIQRGEDRAAVLKRMTDAHEALMATLWAQRQSGLPFTTENEAITLASIVEKETGIAAERPQVAAVFVNRLRLGMRLESDPTIIYGLTRGRPLGRGLRASELASDTPYNTYRIAGLPPTPIANPGRAAIEAVLNPPKSDALFFVADGTGGHVFAATYDEHLRNVEKWRRIERERAGQ